MAKTQKIQPLGDRVLVEPVEEVEQIKGGIYIPDTAKEKPMSAKVIALGSGKLNDDGSRAQQVRRNRDQVQRQGIQDPQLQRHPRHRRLTPHPTF